jgi:hypothetical protein
MVPIDHRCTREDRVCNRPCRGWSIIGVCALKQKRSTSICFALSQEDLHCQIPDKPGSISVNGPKTEANFIAITIAIGIGAETEAFHCDGPKTEANFIAIAIGAEKEAFPFPF